MLIGLGLALVASPRRDHSSTAATTQVLAIVSLDDKLIAIALLKVLSVALALLADTALFAILLSRLSGAHQPWRQVRSAAFLGAVGFELLKLAGTFLIVRTTHNPVYATFGVVVGLLIWINLVSQLLIYVAAWGATQPYSDDPPAAGEVATGAIAPGDVARGGPPPASGLGRTSSRVAARPPRRGHRSRRGCVAHPPQGRRVSASRPTGSDSFVIVRGIRPDHGSGPSAGVRESLGSGQHRIAHEPRAPPEHGAPRAYVR